MPKITVDRIYNMDGDLRAGSWQVIFKTHEGLDYCREPLDGDKSIEDVKQWAEAQCRVHDLGGADIQRF